MIARQSERLTIALRALTIAALIVAAAALVWQPSLDAEIPDESAGAVAGDSLFAFPPVPAARAGDALRVTTGNVFAASRRAPARRYAPASDAATAGGASSQDNAAFDPTTAGDAPSLLGTVLDALGDRALMLVSQVDSHPRFFRVGERAGSYRVRRIEAGRVVLDGPNGRLVLELKPNEARQ